eukprot:scaffold51462_cov65-Phaeocystis_antarctica.AAC.1
MSIRSLSTTCVVGKEVLGRASSAKPLLILTTACIDEALKSSELRLRSRSCGPPAATAGALSKKVPASEPAPSLASTRRPRLSTGDVFTKSRTSGL